MSDDLLTIEEAAKRLDISPLDLRRLLQAKKLPAIEIGAGQWRISEAAVKEFMERGGEPKGE